MRWGWGEQPQELIAECEELGVQSSDVWAVVQGGVCKETRKEQPRVWEKRREAGSMSCDKHHVGRVGEPLSAA